MENAAAIVIAFGSVALFCAALYYAIRFEVWAVERGFRAYERAMIRALTKARVRPDYWDMAVLSWIYSRLAVAFMIGGLLHFASGNQFGLGIFFMALPVWAIAERASDHAMKPRPLDDPYLVMWWECGRLHPPPYATFG